MNTESQYLNMHNPPHPGEVLKELYLEPLELSITEAAKGLGITRKTLSALINQRQGISPEMALRLSKSFNTSPELWVNMQWKYDLWVAKSNVNLDMVEILHS